MSNYGDPDKYYQLKLSRPEAAALAAVAKVELKGAGSEAMLRAGNETHVRLQSALEVLRDFIRAIDHGVPTTAHKEPEG